MAMTNKNLIDHCNSFWDKRGKNGKRGKCEDCKYSHTYCEAFHKKYRTTPYKEDTLDEGIFYTDEEIEAAMNK